MDDHKTRVLICSEDATFARALRRALGDLDVELAATPIRATDAEVIVWQVDGEVPVGILSEVASTAPMIVVGPGEPATLISVVEAGGRGYVPAGAPLEDIVSAVETVAQGGAAVPPALLGALLRHLVERRRSRTAISSALDALTPREREVFRHAAGGARKEEIAKVLYISPETARTHLQRLYRKLGIHSHAELVALAARLGELNLEEEP